jgi:hypothetical protein
MTTTRQDKPGGKPRQRSRKPEQRNQKSDQQHRPKPDQVDEDQVAPMVASSEVPAIEAAIPMIEAAVPVEEAIASVDEAVALVEEAPAPVEMPLIGEVLPPVQAAIGPVETAATVGVQAIANAYADYARVSLQEGRSFVDKLMVVRSFDKAIELQSEFARQAYANFIAESHKICELYSAWTRQMFRPWEIAAARLTQTARQTW